MDVGAGLYFVLQASIAQIYTLYFALRVIMRVAVKIYVLYFALCVI